MAEDADALARTRALDPGCSFIVRAPAGAGKTELLVQRYLALLARVAAPEAIVAITFTVKAAGEMRERILAALASAERGGEGDSEHGRRTLVLARAALERDRGLGWRLSENPVRLQIQTIDALCLRLAQRLPVLARAQGDLRITERPRPYYLAAARMLMDELEDAPAGEHLATLLLHLDGDEQRVVELIADMLDARDRWLRHVARVDSPAMQRQVLERSLAAVVGAELTSIATAAPVWLQHELAMPAPAAGLLPAWLAFADQLLTAAGELRRQPRTLNAAASAVADANRQASQAVLRQLAGHPDFVSRLALVRRLPSPRYDDAQWEACRAMLALLPRAVACLKLIFSDVGTADFTEIAHAALRALGEADAPTDLALALDQRIEHLLVDEFQDTSYTQLDLLLRLTAGWSGEDGRSLFLVGDPMQSIYRFREAEVALFARVEQTGLGPLALVPLQLTRNFRAQGALVGWVNERFAGLFATTFGNTQAVAFAPAQPERAALDGPAVGLHPQVPGDAAAEAHAVVDLILAARREQPPARIAVLVRAREHLSAVTQALRRNGLPFRAVDVQPLAQAMVVQDLHALTRALLHLADRVAWLAVLRAPWCGLTLADLHTLCSNQPDDTVWEAIVDEPGRAGLSEDGRRRLMRVQRVLADALAERGRPGLRRWIEGAWLALGGGACLRSEADRANVQRYLRLLEELDRGGEPARLEELDEALAELYADPDPAADERLQLMTIHRAKGLEFDVVIVPSLGRAPGRRSERLLELVERPHGNGSQLLVAPIAASGQVDPIGRYMHFLEQQSEDEEALRLVYVAATRARNRLHLLGAARASARGVKPRRDSLLARLWLAVSEAFSEPPPIATRVAHDADQAATRSIHRLPVNWSLRDTPAVQGWMPVVDTSDVASDTPEFAWAGDIARQVGRAVHRALDRVGTGGVGRWSALGVEGQRSRLRALLRELGTPAAQLDLAVERAHRAVRATLTDPRGRWLLEHVHADARSEHEIAAWDNQRLVTAVLDRTFVDESGVRWIVDFKIGAHEGGGLDTFLDEEVARYRPQLERYARLMRRLDARPIRVGLYFPLLSAWREWAP